MRTRRRFSVVACALVVLSSLPAAVSAHAPDPVVGGALWAQDQEVHFSWRSGAVPPAAVRDAIRAAAADSNATRGSRAATFVPGGGQSLIGYGPGATCGVNGIACFDRGDAPRSFQMWFREQGHRFDWGALKWCQLDNTSGCYDVENVGLDEFGHVLVLGHHDNFADDSDYLDAVVQTVSRTKPRAGWNEHDYGRCDVATLQVKYDVQTWTAKYATCLSLDTDTTIVSSSSSVPPGGQVTFTATVTVEDLAGYGKLGGNPVSGRTVNLQRRPVGGGSWNTVATMSPAGASGTYRHTLSVSGNYQWRAVFPKPAGEGLQASNAAPVTVTIGACSNPPCPLAAGEEAPTGGPAT
jgi:hypothetical protein